MTAAGGAPRITVAVTTFNRQSLLEQCLESFCSQTLPRDQFQVVVVDDHSESDPAEIVDRYRDRLDITYVRQEHNTGPGPARNTAAEQATAPVFLLFDDDDVASPQLLAEHVASHDQRPEDNVAVLGHTGIHPDVDPSNVLWAVSQIHQTYLSYVGLPTGMDLPWHCAWAGRASFKTSFFLRYRYDVPWMEDTEMAWRMRADDLGVVYNPSAVQYLRENETVESWLVRCRKHGYAAAEVSAIHRELELDRNLRTADARSQLLSLGYKLEAARKTVAQLDPLPRSGMSQDMQQELNDAYWVVFEHERLQAYFEHAVELGIEKPLPTGKRILVVDYTAPMHDRSSGALRLFRLLQMMVNEGHCVTFIAMDAVGQEQYTDELQRMGVEVFATDVERLSAMHGRAVPAGVAPVDIRKLLTERNFDLALIDFYYVAEHYVPEIRRWSPQTRLVIDTIDLHYVREERQARISGDPAAAEHAATMKSREQAIYVQADELIAITEDDKRALLALNPGSRAWIVPNVHNSARNIRAFKERAGFLFVGNFFHPPNAEGIMWFAREVWPRVRRRIPKAHLTVVGNNPPSDLWNVAGIECAGYVPSMEPNLGAARVSVAPLLHGAGMKGKVGEALGAGLPVVATGIAAEGMELVDSEQALIADEADAFADACVQLYNDAALWQKLSDNGRRHVDRLYGDEAVLPLLRAVIEGQADTTPQQSVFLCVPDWDKPDEIKSVLSAYTGRFQPGDDACLYIGVKDASLDEAMNHLVMALTELGLDPDKIANVDVVEWNDANASALASAASL